MKSATLLLALSVAALSSCTTAYKTAQTPDDVYYSPARPVEEYVRSEKEDDRQYRNDDEYYDDRYLKMKVRNRYRWNDFNDWYSYERYGSGYNYIYGSYNNPYNSWNYYYNPYSHGTVIVKGNNNTAYSKPRTFNLNTYTNVTTNNRNSNYFKTTSTRNNNNNTYTAPRNSTRNVDSNSGSILRSIFKSTSNSSSNSNNNSNSSSSGSTKPSSSSSSSSGSSAPVRRF